MIARLSVVSLLLVSAAAAAQSPPLSLDGFADCIHHWKNSHHTDAYRRLAEDDVRGIADHLLLYQRANGGWRENEDPLRILSAEEAAQIAGDRAKTDTSLDNRNTWPQIAYLAGAFTLTHDERYRDACLHGLEFLLSAQHACGGFPHSFPARDGYHPYITFADDVTPDCLRTLGTIAAGQGPFAFVPAELRARCASAVERGNACLLRLQVKQGDVLTAWAGQYDDRTLQPAQARAFELPALVSRESVAVVRYLMSLENPSPEIVAAVEGAVAWYRRTAIAGKRMETFAAEPVKYQWHTSTTDRRVVDDPAAPALWARFYDLATNEPILCNRVGGRVATFAEIDRERRTGYDWYGTWPGELLEQDYPAWRRRVGAR